MADRMTTTGTGGTKAIAEFTPTMSSFYLLLRRLKKTVEIELMYQTEGIDLFAEDRVDDLRDLEIFWEELVETVFDVMLQLPVVPQDRDLHRIAFLMKSVLEMEEPSDRAHFVIEARKHRDIFDCAIPGLQGEITTRLVARFFGVFDQMSELRQFCGTPVKAPPSDCIGMNPA